MTDRSSGKSPIGGLAIRKVERLRRPRFSLLPTLPLVLILLLFVVPALVPGLIAPFGPMTPDFDKIYAPPVFAGGDWTHMLGTDALGRDILSRIIYGARQSALIALAVVGCGMFIGTSLGIVAGYVEGLIDIVIMRLADAMFSIPMILVAIAFVTIHGPSFAVLVGVMVMSLWAQYARIARGETLGLRKRDFVTYARATGVPAPVIMWRHIQPNLMNAIIVTATLHVGWAILVEASLSFVGAGVPPPTPAWGSMIADGRVVLVQAWWVSMMPGAIVVLIVLSINLLGDWMRDRFDPRLQLTLTRTDKPVA